MNLKVLIAAVASAGLLACQADPSTHKLPKPEREIVNKSVNNTYNPAVDILFIIDSSGSMGRFQDRLAENVDFFIDSFFNAKFIDYHIGVTSSDISRKGRLNAVNDIRYVTRTTPDGASILAEMMDVGTSGSATEQFFSIHKAAFSSASLKGYNRGFYRPDAQLAVFLLTDTEDQSGIAPEKAFESLVKLKKGDATRVHYAGAIVTIETENCSGESDQGIPFKLRKAIDLFQGRGFRFNICKKKYGRDLARVAESIVRSVSTIPLDKLPDINSIEVLFGGVPLPNNSTGWRYDDKLNAIRLSPDIDLPVGGDKNIDIRFESIYKPEVVD